MAAITRTSTRIGVSDPTGTISCSCSTRSSRACSAGGDVADLVEEERAAVRLAKRPGRASLRAGERAPHVSEQLALQQPFGERGAIDRDELARAPLREAVDRPRHQLLAGAGLS